MDSKRMRTRAPPHAAPELNDHYPAARQSPLCTPHPAPGTRKSKRRHEPDSWRLFR
ncbi:protein of unknown function [Burkholderia multivorans]